MRTGLGLRVAPLLLALVCVAGLTACGDDGGGGGEGQPTTLSWCLDRSRPGRHVLYYLPRRREDPRRVPVVAPVLERLVVGRNGRGPAS